MTTITTKKTLIAASFDVKAASFDTILGEARHAVVNVNTLIQTAAYSAMYHFVKSFTVSNLQRLFDALCVIDGSVEMHRYESLRVWIVSFFALAKEKDLMKGCPLSVKKDVNDSGIAELAVSWAMDDEGKRKYSLPDSNKEATKPQSDALLDLLAEYANEKAIHTAITDKKAADKVAKKAQAEKDADTLTDAQKLAKDTLAKGKKLDAAKVSVTKSVNKAISTFIENGGSNSDLRAHLLHLIEQITVEAPAVTIIE